jgi:hypothetical protein
MITSSDTHQIELTLKDFKLVNAVESIEPLLFRFSSSLAYLLTTRNVMGMRQVASGPHSSSSIALTRKDVQKSGAAIVPTRRQQFSDYKLMLHRIRIILWEIILGQMPIQSI